MRVRFRESGGLVATFRGVELDAERMPDADAAALRALVRDARPARPRRAARGAAGRDTGETSIDVEDGDASFALALDRRAIPSEALPLVRFLRARARPVPL